MMNNEIIKKIEGLNDLLDGGRNASEDILNAMVDGALGYLDEWLKEIRTENIVDAIEGERELKKRQMEKDILAIVKAWESGDFNF